MQTAYLCTNHQGPSDPFTNSRSIWQDLMFHLGVSVHMAGRLHTSQAFRCLSPHSQPSVLGGEGGSAGALNQETAKQFHSAFKQTVETTLMLSGTHSPFWTCRACRSLICKLHTSVLIIRALQTHSQIPGPIWQDLMFHLGVSVHMAGRLHTSQAFRCLSTCPSAKVTA